MKRYIHSWWIAPLGLLWVSLLAYGLMIPWLGLYADDWPFVYVNHLAGLRGVVDFISWVRPFGAWIFGSVAVAFGQSTWAFHVFLLVLRWVDAMLFWWLLKLLWPARSAAAFWAALLFVVFPAFKQQPLALEYTPHFFALGALFISLGAMVLAVKNRRRFWLLTAISLLFSLNIFTIEYFIGQELLRPVLLWMALSPQETNRRRLAKRVIYNWLPYLAVLCGFLLWRVFVLKFPSYQPELITATGASLSARLAGLAQSILHDIVLVTFGTWVQIFRWPGFSRTGLLTLAVIAAGFLPIFFLLLFFGEKGSSKPASDGRWQWRPGASWMLLGLFSLLAAGWPFWITKLPVTLDFPWDRSTLAFMIGVCLFVAGLVSLIPKRIAQAAILSVLVAFSVGVNFQNANLYRKEWSVFKNFYWQMAWRAPGLSPGTALVLDESPFFYHVDKFLTPVLDWTFAPQSNSLNLPYLFFDFQKIEGRYIPPPQENAPVSWGYGTLNFNSDTSKLLFIAYTPPACLQVLSTRQDGNFLMSRDFRNALAYSHPELVNTHSDPAARPPNILGIEPPHDWCYYFEKADLARQEGDWAKVASLGDQAFAAGYKPQQASELLIFIEGYAINKRLDDARRLSEQVAQDNFFIPALCQSWATIKANNGQDNSISPEIKKALQEFNCQ